MEEIESRLSNLEDKISKIDILLHIISSHKLAKKYVCVICEEYNELKLTKCCNCCKYVCKKCATIGFNNITYCNECYDN